MLQVCNEIHDYSPIYFLKDCNFIAACSVHLAKFDK